MSNDSYRPASSGQLPYPPATGSLPARPPRQAGGGGRDSYRPRQHHHADQEYDRSRRDSRDGGRDYGGLQSAASYFPSTQPPPASAYAALPQPSNFRPDSFRPDSFRPPQSDFTFRADKPPGVGDAQQFYGRETGRPQRGRASRRGDRRGGQPRNPRYLPANRPILQQKHSYTAPTQDFGTSDAGVTYKSLGDLSDSDEADMDISDDSAAKSDQGPAKKRARVGKAASNSNAPQWSNPDPYTALPPTETSQRKKDVVQLIRKARVQAKEGAATSVPAETEDFIPCDLDSDADEEQVSDRLSGNSALPRALPPPGAPTGPRGGQASKQGKSTSSTDAVAGGLNPPRKRTHNDEIKLQLPDHARLKKATKMPVLGFIAYDWRVAKGEDPCPWLKDHSDTPHIGVWLHKEIVDFYDHVKPRQYEHRLRQDLVGHLNRIVRKRFHDAEIEPFGSFMSGLYLPTGDMDLVLRSRDFVSRRLPRYNSKGTLFKLSAHLKGADLALSDDVECITKARVPIIKYIDSNTGLKVDISFENSSGVDAIGTFLRWRDEYPAMPTLVTLVKHFLAMRALNEPVNGGIGGFSVICLVVSMLQLMPQVQSRDMNPEHHYNELLMHFFDLYGNKFNYEANAIRLNPPGYVPKSRVTTFTYKNPERLSIIDPNNPENDIAGGSSNFPAVSKVFSDAHKALQDRMTALARSPDSERKNKSILGAILEGNYSSFRTQRDYFRKLYEKTYGPLQD